MARYFITGGGTGGHIYPAIAVAEGLLEEQRTGRQEGRSVSEGRMPGGMEVRQDNISFPRPLRERVEFVSEQGELTNSGEGLSEEQRTGGQEGRQFNGSNVGKIHQEQQADKDLSPDSPIALSPDNSLPSYPPVLHEIFYIGNPQNLEYDIVKQKGYKFLPVNIHGMPRKLSFSLIKWLFQLDIAVLKCCYYILKYKPDTVFGTGGYVSAPALFAAKLLNVPFMLHDCDAQPGLVTRYLAPYASAVSVAFEPACKFLNNKNCFVNGNPIRSEFQTLTKEDARKDLGIENKFTLCIMGGSQGAKSINNSAVNILEKLSKEHDLQIIFQTGKKNYEDVIGQLLKIYPEYEQDKNLIVRPYFDNMVTVLKSSDIAVSRSGSLSISEICASAIAPIFVPYPYAAADHQRKNAKYMVENNAGLYIDDNDINSKILYETIEELVKNKNKLNEIQQNSFKLAHLNGTEQIVNQLKKIIK